jgi:hypothetical protein
MRINYLMNTIKNKAYLWEKCISLGIFENIHKDMAPRIQTTFENVIEGFSNRKENVDILNQECIIRIKEEIGKLNTFEERQKEYDTLLNKAPPTKIDFSDKIDEPIQNIESLVERTQNNRQEIFKQLDKPDKLPNTSFDPLLQNASSNTSFPSNTSFQPKSMDSFTHVMKSQNNILIKILETQHKILELLQNKK